MTNIIDMEAVIYSNTHLVSYNDAVAVLEKVKEGEPGDFEIAKTAAVVLGKRYGDAELIPNHREMQKVDAMWVLVFERYTHDYLKRGALINLFNQARKAASTA